MIQHTAWCSSSFICSDPSHNNYDEISNYEGASADGRNCKMINNYQTPDFEVENPHLNNVMLVMCVLSWIWEKLNAPGEESVWYGYSFCATENRVLYHSSWMKENLSDNEWLWITVSKGECCTKFIIDGPRASTQTAGARNQFPPVKAKTRRDAKPVIDCVSWEKRSIVAVEHNHLPKVHKLDRL